jgi:hypothetical protein
MSTLLSSSPVALGKSGSGRGISLARRFDGSRSLATMLLAAAVAALVVLADQMIGTWADGHLFLGWVALWVVIFAGSALFAGTARRMAQATLRSLDSWSRSLAEARAEARLWDLARTDPRLKAELLQARARQAELADAVAAPAAAQDDFSQALSPMGMDAGISSPAVLRRWAQLEVRRHAGYLPVLSSTPASLGSSSARPGVASNNIPRLHSRFDGARGLAALLLAAVVAALVVLADQLISRWTDEHLFLGWLALWLVILAGSALFAAPARHLARRALPTLQGWAQALAEARAEQRLWDAAHRDPRLMADLIHARQRDLDAGLNDSQPWGRYPERLSEGREQQVHLNHA